jgi:hypothetical protein
MLSFMPLNLGGGMVAATSHYAELASAELLTIGTVWEEKPLRIPNARQNALDIYRV